MVDQDISDLTKEKGLFDLYKLLRRIPQKNSAKVAIFLTFLALAGHAEFFSVPDKFLLDLTRQWAAFWLTAAVTILGFLIAAFTIFATLAKPDMLIAMHRMKHGSGMSFLKYNLVSFIGGIVYYFLYIVLCWLIITLGAPGGLVSGVFCGLDAPLLKRSIIVVAYVFTGGGAFVILWNLKTYIFNVYAIVMSNLRWDITSRRMEDRNRNKASSSKTCVCNAGGVSQE